MHAAGLLLLWLAAVSTMMPVPAPAPPPAVLWLAPAPAPEPEPPVRQSRPPVLAVSPLRPQFVLPARPRLKPARPAVLVPPLLSAKIDAPARTLLPEPAPQAVPAPRIQTDLFAGMGAPAGPARSAVVATGGFSPVLAPTVSSPVRSVRSGGFGDVVAAAPATPPPKVEVPGGPTSPVEILAKPNPAYTDEARRLGIEGEVVLRVLFAASGRVEVLSLVRGLGHGLDERAAEAARRIRFRPALEQGRPVDFAALVHMTFQLAY